MQSRYTCLTQGQLCWFLDQPQAEVGTSGVDRRGVSSKERYLHSQTHIQSSEVMVGSRWVVPDSCLMIQVQTGDPDNRHRNGRSAGGSEGLSLEVCKDEERESVAYKLGTLTWVSPGM